MGHVHRRKNCVCLQEVVQYAEGVASPHDHQDGISGLESFLKGQLFYSFEACDGGDCPKLQCCSNTESQHNCGRTCNCDENMSKKNRDTMAAMIWQIATNKEK